MKKITLLVAFLVAAFSYGQTQTSSGFVLNPSFEDGSAATIAGGGTVDNWKLGGDSRNDEGVSADIQTTNVHAGDGTNALEVTSNSSGGTGKEWHIRLINTTYPFAGDNSADIEVTVRFWAKTTDAAPGSANAAGDMRLVVKDTGPANLGEKTQRVLLTTGAWAYIIKTFTFPAAANYSLSLFLDFGLVDGVTQIDGITTSVTGGATIGDGTAPVINLVGDNPQQLTRGDAYVELGATATDATDDDTALTATIAIDASDVDTATAGSYSVTYDVSDAAGNPATQVTRTVTVEDGQTSSGFVKNPSFEDGSAAAIAGGATLNDWKLGGGSRNAEGVSASIQTTNVHDGDGTNALEVTSVETSGEWNIRLINTTYPFAGDNSTPIEVTVRFWAKTTDAAPGSAVENGDMKLLVKDTGSANLGDKTNSVLLTTGAWAYIIKTFTFPAAADYSLSLYLEFGKLDGVTQIDGITTSVTGGATIGDGIAPLINLVGANPQQLTRGDAYVELGATATDDTDDDTALTATIAIDASDVDTATAGSYSVTYDVSDAAGNPATQVTRTVTVEDGQTSSGFVKNPSFEDGSAAAMVGGVALNDWKLIGGSASAEGFSASIQTTNVHAGDGTNALEVTSNNSGGTGDYWDIAVINTTYPFVGDNSADIEVTVRFWAKTTDAAPGSENSAGDMRLRVKDTGSNPVEKYNAVLLTTGAWAYIEKTFTFPAAADYSLSLYFEFGKLDGVTQIEGITTSVTGGASIGDATAPVINLVGANPQQLTRGDAYVELGATATDATDDDTALTATIAIDATAVDTATAGSYSVTYDVSDAAGNPAIQLTRTVIVEDGQTSSGFVANPSFEDGSAAVIAGGATLNEWKLGGGSRNAEGVSASIQTTNVHAGDGTNALEVTSVETSGEWNIRLISTTYPFAGDNSADIEVTVSFWAKTTDAAPGSVKANGDMRLLVKDTGPANLGDQTNNVLLTTGAWAYITKTFTFAAAADYSLSLYLEFGKLDGVTQIDGITTSVTGGATLASDSITWNGSTDKDWNTTTNWTPERVPTATEEAIIPAGLTNYPTISSGAITVAAIDIKSGAAFVANGTATVTGAATYSRNLTHTAGNGNGWYLVASPLVGATFDDTWVNANSLATGSGTNRGLATYTESANTWDYFLTGESGTFTPGTGYSVKRSATGDVSFTGTINTADTDVTLVRTGNGFNLVANPYTSYINSEILLDDNTIVSNNKNIYVWNNGTTSYDTKISSAAFQVAPGQAFFVRSNELGGTLTFAESNQSDNSGTDTFQRTAATIPEIELSVADESTHRYIKLYFNDAATKGFDNGYDGDLFGGVANSFEIYSHLLEDNQGEKYQIQSLPNSDLASMVIPVGLKATSGKELAFSVKKLNLPTDIKVYLEDRVTNTFTLLDETNSVYNITLSSAIDGIGRFYLHTSNSVLSTSDVNLNSVSIFKINNSNLRVAGLSQGKASISLYNILGKQMMMTTFDAINSNDISLPKLAAGVYIVQLTTEAGKLNKKIILK